MKTTTKFAIAAVASALMGSSALAADLGGSCCADLEERIAELEATTVRKGNRKVSVQVSGYVSQHILFWDDGTQSDMYHMDGGNNGSRWRFRGEAKISPEITAGFLTEFQITNNNMLAANQLNGGDDLGSAPNTIRDITVWMQHKRLGKIKMGQGSTSTDNLNLIDLGGTGVASTPDSELWQGAFILRSNAGLLGNATTTNWAQINRGHESFDTSRRDHVLYETPSLAGFTVQAAVAEDNFWDVALRYAGEFNGVRVAFGVGYLEDTEFNRGSQLLSQTGALCATNCDVKVETVSASGSVLHVPTGLFFTAAYGHRELEGSTDGTAATAYTGPDIDRWYIKGGVNRNFFGIGNTSIFAEYENSEGAMEQGTFIGTQGGAYALNVGGVKTSSEMEMWGIGMVQNIDAAAMEVFWTYKNFSAEANGFLGANASLNKGQGGISDFDMFMVGTRISF